MIHTSSATPPDPALRTTAPGVRKMPDPITVPTTMKIKSPSDSVRRRLVVTEVIGMT